MNREDSGFNWRWVQRWQTPERTGDAASMSHGNAPPSPVEGVELSWASPGVPDAPTTRRWLRDIPESCLVHVRALQTMVADGVEGRTREDVDRDGATVRAVFSRFVEGIEPIRETGRLSSVILSFPPHFVASRGALRSNMLWLRRCREELSGYPLVVELTHPSWHRGRVGMQMHRFFSDEGMSWMIGPNLPMTEWPALGPTAPRVFGRAMEPASMAVWLAPWCERVQEVWMLAGEVPLFQEEDSARRGAN